jgi:hypothetical protein
LSWLDLSCGNLSGGESESFRGTCRLSFYIFSAILKKITVTKQSILFIGYIGIALALGGGAGGGSSGGGGGSRGGGGSSRSGGGTTSNNKSYSDDVGLIIFGAAMGALCLILFLLWLRHRLGYGRSSNETITNPETGEVTRMHGVRDDTSTVEYCAGKQWCSQNPVNYTYVPQIDIGDGFDAGSSLITKKQVSSDTFKVASDIQNNLQETIFAKRYLDPSVEHHYFEVKINKLERDAVLAIGLCARPYPTFRMPGWHRMSVAIHSDDGNKFFNNSYGGVKYAPAFKAGDVIGIGYIKSTGALYLTVNGTKLPNAYDRVFLGLNFPVFFSLGFRGQIEVDVKFPETNAVSSSHYLTTVIVETPSYDFKS